MDGVHFVYQRIAQHMDVKRVAHCKLVNVRKQLGTCQSTVRRQHRVGSTAAYRQGRSYHMTHGTLQRVRVRAVLHRQIYADLGDVHIGHDTTHRELFGIGQGRGGSPSLCDGRLAGQHSVVLLCGLPLGSQFGIIGVFNSGGVDGFYV